ncbi:MAG: helix-turn-helix domain-containing protein, partial [Candidatus Thiodiazotropha sp.]
DLHLPENHLIKTSQTTESSKQPLGDKMEQVERQAIIEALEETRWNKTAAAKKLGMTLRSLRYRLKNSILNRNLKHMNGNRSISIELPQGLTAFTHHPPSQVTKFYI